MIHEDVFYRKRKTSWSLRLDSEAGTVRVRCRKDLKAGVEIFDMTPAQFAASGKGNGYEHRAFQSRMKLLEGAVSAKPKPKSEEHKFELKSIMTNKYTDICLKKKQNKKVNKSNSKSQ